MAHFAEIDANNVVVRVIVVPDEEEHRGAEFCSDDLGLGGTWIQTSYNANMRKQFAGIGDVYNAELDVFLSAQPYKSWTLDENNDWQPPTPKPVINSLEYHWVENNQEWEYRRLPEDIRPDLLDAGLLDE